MPVARFQMPDGRIARFEVPEGTTPEQAQAMVAQQMAPKPAASRAAPKIAQADKPTSFWQGVGDEAQRITDRIPDPIQAISHALGFKAPGDTSRAKMGATMRQASANAPTRPSAWGRLATDIGVTALIPGGPILQGAIGGGILSDSKTVGGTAKDMALGAAAGKAGDMAGRFIAKGAGAVMRGVTPTALSQSMKARGITPTIGDTIGGRAKNFESRLSKMPIVGGAIRDFQGKQYGQMLRAASDEVLAPIGKTAPPGPPGRAMYAGTKDLADEAYRSAVSGISGTVDEPLLAAVKAPPSLTEPQRAAYDDLINAEVAPRIKEGGTLAGEDVQALKEILDDEIKAYARTPGYKGLISPLRKLREELMGFVERNSPDGGAAYRNARATYGRAKVLQKAVEASKTDGIPTALQLANAVRQNARKYNGDAYARGVAPLQGLSDEAAQMLPTTIPDPGTAGQLGLLNLLAHPIRNGVPALAGAAASVPYTAPGNAALQALLIKRPDLVRRLGQQAPQLAAPFGMIGTGVAVSGASK